MIPQTGNDAKVEQDSDKKKPLARSRTGKFEASGPFGRLIFSSKFETFGGIVVFFNFLIMTLETNAHAINDEPVLEFVKHANRILLLWYSFECGSRLYLLKMEFFFGAWNLLDFSIVFTGIFSEIMEAATGGGGGGSLEQISMLKSLRMLRLLRLVRLLVAFRELYVLVAGIARCMKTLFWASLLIFVVLNVWSIMSVEYLREPTHDLADMGMFGSCGWCAEAFSNIWLANLTWFQIISGDGWSNIGRPLVEEYWWPYIFFLSSIFIIVWGLLNLIVAAIVDANIAAREDDVASAARMVQQAQADAWTQFQRVCNEMDADGSGTVTVDEFQEFLQDSDELKQHLTTMGISEKDVDGLLKIMDTDGSGDLETAEFIDQFTQMKTLVVKTTLFYLLKYAEYHTQDLANVNSTISSLGQEIRDLKSHVGGTPLHPPPSPCTAQRAAARARQTVTQGADLKKQANHHQSKSAATACAEAKVNLSARTTHDVPEPVSSRLDTEKRFSNLPGWYYCGDAPPAHAVSFWERVGSPSEPYANGHSKNINDELASAVTRAQSLYDHHRNQFAEAAQQLGEPRLDQQVHSISPTAPRKTPASVTWCTPSSCVNDDLGARSVLNVPVPAQDAGAAYGQASSRRSHGQNKNSAFSLKLDNASRPR